MDEKKSSPPGYNEVPTHGMAPEAPPQYGQPMMNPYPQQQYQVQYAGGPYQQTPGYYNQQRQAITNQPTTVIINPGPLTNPPPDHMAYSIFVTLCCCWPIGIFAIMKSMESRDATNRGNQEMAFAKSKEAKRFGNWALGIGIGMMVLSFIIIGVYIGIVLTGSLSQY